jgi:hypothetical protein
MRLRYLAVCASLLAAAACGDETKNPALPDAEASRVTATANPRWSLYDSQTPTENLDATGGWEVGTRFSSTARGRVVGFRFYRAAGETGTNYGRLWTNTGTKLKTSNPFPSGTGWVTVMLDNPVEISANTTYRVSVNTNTRQAKTGGGYAYNGALSNGPLYSDGGYYGQPAGAFPTSSSASYFFIDVIFEEYVVTPKPDLYIYDINPFSGSSVVITVCNAGDAPAAASYTRYYHWQAPPVGNGQVVALVDLSTPAMNASECKNIPVADPSPVGYAHDYQATADIGGVVAESNESNNWAKRTWRRY